MRSQRLQANQGRGYTRSNATSTGFFVCSPATLFAHWRVVFGVATFLVVGFLLWAALLSDNQSMLGVSNWVVPDGQTYYDVLRVLHEHGVDVMSQVLPASFSGVPVNPFLFIFYHVFSVFHGAYGYLIANSLLLLVICRYAHPASLLLQPYFLISAVLPSKDLLVLALFLLFLQSLSRHRYLNACLLTLLIFLTRDGAGLIATLVLCAHWVLLRTAFSPGFVVLVFFSFASTLNFFMGVLFDDLFIFTRNLDIAESEGVYDLTGSDLRSFWTRIFGNLTNLAFRPVFFDERGDFALLGFLYWLSGVFSLTALVLYLFAGKCFDVHTRRFYLCMFGLSLCLISLNPLVQPRYLLMLTIPMVSAGIQRCAAHIWLSALGVVLFLSSVAAVTYYQTDIGLPTRYEIGRPHIW